MGVERRDFLKSACGLCASLVGISIVLPAISGCSPLQSVVGEVNSGKIALPITAFATDSNLVVVRNEKLEYDIAVVRYSTNSFRAFQLQCTHRAYPLVATKTGFFCNQHGSRFDMEGKVIQTPATTNLKEYKILQESENLNIIL